MSDTSAGEPAVPATSTRDRVRNARLPERTVDVCLRGDLQAEWEDLHRQLADVEAAAAKDKRLNGDKHARGIAQRILAVQDRMREDTIVFRMRGLPGKQWDALLKAHPPRPDNDSDAQLGYNTDEFIAALVKTCTYLPDDLDEDTWRELLGDNDTERARRQRANLPVEDGKLTEWQQRELQDGALAVNVRKVNVPNSFAASRLTRSS